MTTTNRYFGNIFDNVHISPGRLSNFATVTLYKLIRANTNNIFDNIIALLTPLIIQMDEELSNVDATNTHQKWKTFNLNQITFLFHHTLSKLEGVIARALGGDDTEAYVEFFPRGLTEYDNANRIDTSILVNRIYKAADKYSDMLDTDVKNELQAFKTSWEKAYKAQGSAKAKLSFTRVAKYSARTTLELTLMQAIFTVGLQYAGDEDKCGSFFDFNLLYHIAHHKHDLHEGMLAVKEIKTIINRMMTDTVKIRAANTGTNADIIIWKGATETEPAPTKPITIKPGKSTLLVSSKVGKYEKPFLLIQNISEVNIAEYEVEVIG